MLQQSFQSLNIAPADGSIEILVRDDDGGYSEDEIIGRLKKPFKDITRENAVIDTLTGTYVTMSVELEVR